jgi:hypothetical protein
MALKWASSLVTVAALAAFTTANVVGALMGGGVPVMVNALLITVCALATLLTVLAELYRRLEARLEVLSEFLVDRLDDIVAHLDELDAEVPVMAAPAVDPFLPPRPHRVASHSPVITLAARAGRQTNPRRATPGERD